MHIRSFVRLGCGVFAALFLNAQAGSAQELYPNLVALPASQFSIAIQNGHILLRFAATSWNNGAGPLELRSGAASESQGQNVFQRIYRSDGGYSDVLAGTYIWHPTHNHFHFGDFAMYTLNEVGDPGNSQTSAKTSFCVMDTTKVDTTIANASNTATYTTCNKVVQGMSVGWGDTYGPTLTGQSFDITGLDGYYDLTIESDPNDRLIETNESDNVSCVRLRINAVASPATAQAVGTCGSVSISGISPTQIKKGTTIQVEITGSGFAEGMAVGFENGSGAAPVVSAVSVEGETLIRANVSVKSGGSKTPRYWDLRVGSALYYRAIVVTP